MWNKIERFDDSKENVAKFIYTKDDAVVESVLYKYPTYDERTVICCSTQSGCPVGCRFCGAGDYFARSLKSSEIVSQVDYSILQTGIPASEIKRLQVMFMSMGEPFLNWKGLKEALYDLYESYPNAALLVSTSGPDVDYCDFNQVSTMIPTIGLQFSVHESTDEARNKLIPFKKKLTLAGIVKTGISWFYETGRKPFFNYCAHDGNVSELDVDRISTLFDPKIWNATISVVCERSEGFAKANEHQRDLAVSFANSLLQRNFNTRVFDPAGQDTIGGGCGQLFQTQKWMKEHPDKARPSVGNGKAVVHSPTRQIFHV